MNVTPEEHRKHVRNRYLIGIFAILLIILGLFITPTNSYRMEPGPTYELKKSVTLPEPYTLQDSEGSWRALTVQAYPLKVIDEVILQLTGRKDELYKAASADGPAGTTTEGEAMAARQISLNVALDEVTDANGFLLLEGTERTDVPAGSRLISVNGAPPAEGTVEPGTWLVVEPDGDFAVHDVKSSSTTATAETPREHVEPLMPLEPGLDAVDTTAFDLPEVGGSSAGLVSTLAWVDVLTDGDLTGGRDIAATGTVTEDGKVIPVAGVQFKLESAAAEGVDITLVPKEYDGPVPDGLEVVRVGTVQEALEVLAE